MEYFFQEANFEIQDRVDKEVDNEALDHIVELLISRKEKKVSQQCSK
jgi:hypothetical protein